MNAVFHWSGGKDSAIALYKVLQNDQFQVKKLLTTINQHHSRVTMHGVREELIQQQAELLGIPLKKLMLPENPSMETYEGLMESAMNELKSEGIAHAIYGDIFLEDLRKYREQQLHELGFETVFPIWKRDTKELLLEFIELGFKTILVSVKSECLDQSFAGRVIDRSFLDDLPGEVDPCGENGEFHTFVFDGPIFPSPVQFEVGETVYRSYPSPDGKDQEMGFWFCDLKTV